MPDIRLSVLGCELSADIKNCIAAVENEYSSCLEQLAGEVVGRGIRVVLLAGPSASGKTTTANLLADVLKRMGHAATVISLDDFYRPLKDPDYPRNPDGSLDFESPDSIRIDLVRQTISRILHGEPAPLPRYEFKRGLQYDNATVVNVPEGGCAIIEGLHALNPELTRGVTCGALMRVFVNVSTNLLDDAGTCAVPGDTLRFIRRLTRDFLYRSSGARRTLELWGLVKAGEEKNLYPHRETADVCIDTFHRYEVGVLKPWTERVIEEDPMCVDPQLDIVKSVLAKFDAVPLDDVPVSSLIREFVPGGMYEHLY